MDQVHEWDLNVLDKLTAFPTLGQSIKAGTKYILKEPKTTDLLPDINIRKYHASTRDPSQLLPSDKKDRTSRMTTETGTT